MKKWILITSILVLFCQGCVVIPKRDNTVPESIEVASELCEKIGVMATFVGYSYSDFSIETIIDPKEKWRGSRNPSFYIISEMSRSGIIQYPAEENDSLKYFITYKIISKDYKNLFQRTTLWVSDLTLGILPGWGDGEFYLSAEINDRDGTKFKEYTSAKVNFDYYHGLLLLPINYYEHTAAHLYEKFLPLLTREIIGKMINDKLIKCK